MTSNVTVSAAPTTLRNGKPVVIARLIVPEYAGHDRTIRVAAGSHDIVMISDWRSTFVAIRFTGTLVRNTWNGRPTGGEKSGDSAKASGSVYVYEVARAAAGTLTGRRFWGGRVELAEGFKLIAEDDGAIVYETTGELVRVGCVIPAAEIPAYLAHVAKVRAEQAAKEAA